MSWRKRAIWVTCDKVVSRPRVTITRSILTDVAYGCILSYFLGSLSVIALVVRSVSFRSWWSKHFS